MTVTSDHRQTLERLRRGRGCGVRPCRPRAGSDARRVGLSGEWWASWQTYKDGEEVHTFQQITIRQRGDLIQIATTDRGNATLDEGGYTWRGELRLWDNEALIGWYTANDDAVRSKGSMFFHLHPHGQHITGRWVGLSHDGPLITGVAAIAKTREAALANLDNRQGGSDR
ncbi:MAG: hypothetical protein WBG36_05835 [Ornithinimicrobium sp.]